MNTTRLPSLFTPEPFLFDDAFRTFMRPFRWEAPAADAPAIPMDVVENEDAYVVTAQIPGVPKEAIHVEIDGRQVMITAEYKKPMVETKEARMLRSELAYGFASRVFTLAYEVDRTKAAARYADGVLTLTLPKLVTAAVAPLVIE